MKISVVMATYNGERYLDQQIQSILNQTHAADELIVCDDCSTDNTVAMLEKYRLKGQLTYTVNATQLGLIDNFKRVVSLAAEENYIALCDQDDQWLPDKLEKSADLLSRIEDKTLPCLVYSDLILVDENDHVLNPSFRSEYGQNKYQHNLQTLVFGNFVLGCTVLFNSKLRQLFASTPNNVRLNHDGWLALLAFTFGKAASVKEPLVRYRKHGNNVSIAADAKPRNRYLSTIQQLTKAFNGNDDFLAAQVETVGRFYDSYQSTMGAEANLYFKAFLRLAHQPYLIKKLAFRKTVRKFPV